MTPLSSHDDELLRGVRVATPCNASWDEMPGGDRVRSCEHCRKRVYNLSAMTATEAAKLVREAEGKACVRYYARPDGTMLTQDCPVGVARVRARIARAVAAASGAVFAAGLTTGAFRSGGGEPPAIVRWLNQLRGTPAPSAAVMGGMDAPEMPLTQGQAAAVETAAATMGEMIAEPAPPPDGWVTGMVAVSPPPPTAPPVPERRMGRVQILPMARPE